MEGYYIIIIIAIVLIVLFLVLTYYINKTKEKLMYEQIESLTSKHNYNFEKAYKKRYDFIITKDDRKFYIKVLSVQPNSSVTVNSKFTWCLRFGGHRVGRNYPNKRYLTEIEPFLRLKLDEDKDMKIIIIYPNTEVILRYVNESDIVEVNYKDTIHGYKVIKYSDFIEHFEDSFYIKGKNNFK